MLRKIGLVRFLIDRKEKLLLKGEQFFLARILVKRKLGFIDGAALVGIFHHAQQLFIARLTKLQLEHETAAGLDIALFKFFNRFAGHPVAKHVLLPDQLLNERFPFVVLMGGNRRRPADDERRARFIDQNGIDFVDNGIVIAALDLLFARSSHAVVAQVIETELAVRSVSDVHRVLFAANIRLLVVLDAPNC